jgi:hypothetical protein
MNDVIEMLAAVSPDVEDEPVPSMEDVWRKLDSVAEGKGAAPRALRASGRGRRRGDWALRLRGTAFPTVVLGVGAVAALCGSALAAADALGIVDLSGSVSPPTRAYIGSFSVWQRPAAPQDSLPGSTGDEPYTEVRLVSTSSDPTSQWIAVAADGRLCVILSDRPFGSSALPSACLAASTIANGSQLLIAGAYAGNRPTSPGSAPSAPASGPFLFGGVAPDGITAVHVLFADGDQTTVPVTSNGFQFSTTSLPTQYTWTTPDGIQHTQGRGNTTP